MSSNLVRFPTAQESLSVSEGRAAAERALATPIADRTPRARELRVEHPEVLLCLCEALTRRIAEFSLTLRLSVAATAGPVLRKST